MNEVRKKAIAAAALADCDAPDGRFCGGACDMCLATARNVIKSYETAMLEGGAKMCPRKATDDMVRREAAKMSAPLGYMKRKWAAIWDAAPGVNGEHQ